ncbi:MAG TPA: SusC/RagA family TonB-linked outer membrane protein [Flavisolibacter sp.]|nr:SusC/RagA family TonB-linked outer membrane protein [Flavisolibacter sp.]
MLLLLVVLCSQASAQRISFSFKNGSLETAFREIEKQTPYRFVYTKEELSRALPVTVEAKSWTLEQTLAALFEGQPLAYRISDKMIMVHSRPLPSTPAAPPGNELKGRVTSEDGVPLAGATVEVEGGASAATDGAGRFELAPVDKGSRIRISSVGFYSNEIVVGDSRELLIILKTQVSSLDETVLIAYGSTTRRLSTGNVSKVSGVDIARQPVSNPLTALQGRVAGLLITSTSGITGSSVKVQLRGQTSIGDIPGSPDFLPQNNPLFIIDGVPFEQGNKPYNNLANASSQAGLSPFNSINPADIESIEVLKDADATAIYGSRGANGVMLITTKKGKAGKTKFSVNMYTGFSRVSRTMDLLNTAQYVEMRKEAFLNDSVAMTLARAPDILSWDTTRYTDFTDLLIGGTAKSSDAQLSLSGGNEYTQFILGAGFHRETNVFSDQLANTRPSARINLRHRTADGKFNANFTAYFSSETNRLMLTDLTQFIRTPPNLLLYDSSGKLAWSENGINFSSISHSNPLAELLKRYEARTQNLNTNLVLDYAILKGLKARVNLGYNIFNTDEKQAFPRAAESPAYSLLPSARFSYSTTSSWIVEPQLEYQKTLARLKIGLLVGCTAQERTTSSQTLIASDYTSDDLLGSISGAGSIDANDAFINYKYAAVFGRINLNWKDKYVVNLTGRRDGSSRFGPERRFANFGAVGAAWIFSSEEFVRKNLAFIDFGKLRASYGITGNDQIGDYRYIRTWQPGQNYAGAAVYSQSALYNPFYNWESNTKMEAEMSLGFFKSRFLLSFLYYRNTSGNLLINYPLAYTTGFLSIMRNWDAKVQNTGWEFTLQTRNIVSKNFSWQSSINLTIPQSKLLAFPGVSNTPYQYSLEIGQPLTIVKKYVSLGVDPQTGIYLYEDIDKDGKLTSATDLRKIGDAAPKFYGGIQNTLRYRGFELEIFIQFKKQIGQNFAEATGIPAGTAFNQPELLMDRWQKPGDLSDYQKFTQLSSKPAYQAAVSYRTNSSAVFSDASYLRLQNLALSYQLSNQLVKAMKMESGRVYVNGQNLFMLTGYKGADPEVSDFLVLPTLRTIVAGIQLNF